MGETALFARCFFFFVRLDDADVEFIVQYLILAHARRYPQLLDNYGNIALLNIAADCGLIDKTLAEQSRTAYRFYRQQQHNTKLRDAEKTEVTDELLTHLLPLSKRIKFAACYVSDDLS